MIPADPIVNISIAMYHLQTAATLAVQHLLDKIAKIYRAVCKAIETALHPPSPDWSFTAMQPHPHANPYSRSAKTKPWPWYLDINWGYGDDTEEIDRIADKIEPLEQVTPYHAAVIRRDRTALLRLLSRNIAKVDAKDYRGQTPFYWAAYFGNLVALMNLHRFGAKLDEEDYRGKTPLRAAVKHGHLHVIDYLASHGADLNRKDGRGLTPLQLAAYRGDVKTYEALRMLGADDAVLDANNKTPKDILENSCKRIYFERFFLTRLFTSPEPSYSLRPYNIYLLSQARQNAGGK